VTHSLTGILLICAALSACGAAPSVPAKIDSPPPDQLSAQQLESITADCMRYQNMDDPRVPYAHAYCSQVLIERDVRDGKALKAQQAKNPWTDPNYLKRSNTQDAIAGEHPQ